MRLTLMPLSLRSACANLQTSSETSSQLYVRSSTSFPNTRVARCRSPLARAYEDSSFTFHKPGQVPHVERTSHRHPSLPVDAAQLGGVHDGQTRVGREKLHVLLHQRAHRARDTRDKIVQAQAQAVPQLRSRPPQARQSKPRNVFLPWPLRVSI